VQRSRLSFACAVLLTSACSALAASGPSDGPTPGSAWSTPSKAEGRAAYELGLTYLEGRNGDVDEKEAVRWFSVAARSHVPEAELELSFSEEDQSRRLEYLKEAVSHGLPEAEFELGIAYVEGEATLAADIPTGMEWLTKAAERSFAPAFYRLGIMHLEGEGVEQDSVQGCGLLAVAAALAFDAPVDELLGRCRESAPEQRQAADRLASDWLSRLGSTADGGGRSR